MRFRRIRSIPLRFRPPEGRRAIPHSSAIPRNVKFLRKHLHLSQTAFAKTVGVEQPTVSRWERGEDTPDDLAIRKMAAMVGCEPGEFRYSEIDRIRTNTPPEDDQGKVPLVGYIGAGERVYPIDDHAMGAGLEKVDRPPDAETKDKLVAVRIRGDSMRPLKDGWIIYYSRSHNGVPYDAINKLCVVQIKDGPVLIKELRRGYQQNTYNLISWTAGVDPMEDQILEWAAPVLYMAVG